MQLKSLQVKIKNFLQDKQKPTNIDATPLYGLNIYKQNYFKSLAGALADKYPVTLKHLGAEAHKLIYNFISESPSTSPNLDDYGDEFPRYLINNNFTLAAKLSQIDLELFLSLGNYEKPISASDLAHINPVDFDRLTLKLNTALRLIKVSAQDFEVWEGLSKDSATVKGHSKDALQYLTISLVLDQIIINIVSASYHRAFEFIKSDMNILEMTAKILETDSNFSLSEFLAFSFNNHLVAGFSLNEQSN